MSTLMQSGALRWLAVVVLAPLMALGTFGGARVLVHSHDEGGLHFHVVGRLKGVELASAVHADHHGQARSIPTSVWTAHCDETGCDEDPDEVPEGVIVSIENLERLPARGTELGKSLLPTMMIAIAVLAMPPKPDLCRHVGSSGGGASGGPLDLVALNASERLLRTSRALLL